MNTIPITITLYYPTMAQVESYLSFLAMLSIAANIVLVSLPAWYWPNKKAVQMKNQLCLAPVFLGLNPAGSILLLSVHKFVIDLNDISGKIGFPLFFAAPVAALWIHAAI